MGTTLAEISQVTSSVPAWPSVSGRWTGSTGSRTSRAEYLNKLDSLIFIQKLLTYQTISCSTKGDKILDTNGLTFKKKVVIVEVKLMMAVIFINHWMIICF